MLNTQTGSLFIAKATAARSNQMQEKHSHQQQLCSPEEKEEPEHGPLPATCTWQGLDPQGGKCFKNKTSSHI